MLSDTLFEAVSDIGQHLTRLNYSDLGAEIGAVVDAMDHLRDYLDNPAPPTQQRETIRELAAVIRGVLGPAQNVLAPRRFKPMAGATGRATPTTKGITHAEPEDRGCARTL